MTEINDEVFTQEFIHETVTKLLKEYYIDRSITLIHPSKSGDPTLATKMYEAFLGRIKRYFSSGLTKEQQIKLELEIFDDYSYLLTSGVIVEKDSISKIENEIERLEARIDSTNKLLVYVLETLKAIKNKIDKLP